MNISRMQPSNIPIPSKLENTTLTYFGGNLNKAPNIQTKKDADSPEVPQLGAPKSIESSWLIEKEGVFTEVFLNIATL